MVESTATSAVEASSTVVTEKITPAPEASTTEDKASRQSRKEEAKKLKRKRIEEAGGVRPRQPPTNNNTNTSTNTNRSRPKPRHTQRNPKKSTTFTTTNKNDSGSSPTHRFGKVMEQTPCPNRPRTSTLTIAVPGSVVSNAQTQELRTRLVGQIARAAAVYHVDEVVVFDDALSDELKVRPVWGADRRNRGGRGGAGGGRGRGGGGGARDRRNDEGTEGDDGAPTSSATPAATPTASSNPHAFMARILQYCECPQYFRRHFFPMHPDLQFAGLLPPIDAPHHVRLLDRSEFREGVVLDKKIVKTAGTDGGGSIVNCGIPSRDLQIDRVLPAGIRCTVQIDRKAYATPGKKMRGTVVSPSTPREKNGTYWGYTTRLAPSLRAIFDESPYPGGYDFKIGTSERGDVTVDDRDFHSHFDDVVLNKGGDDDDDDDGGAKGDGGVEEKEEEGSGDSTSRSFKHALIVFGGVAGIEECVDADETLKVAGSDSRSLFDMWVNTCPYQGSRTIRTEEAIWLSLARLRPHLFPANDSFGANTKTESRPARVKTIATPKPVEFSDSAPSEESSDEDES